MWIELCLKKCNKKKILNWISKKIVGSMRGKSQSVYYTEELPCSSHSSVPSPAVHLICVILLAWDAFPASKTYLHLLDSGPSSCGASHLSDSSCERCISSWTTWFVCIFFWGFSSYRMQIFQVGRGIWISSKLGCIFRKWMHLLKLIPQI